MGQCHETCETQRSVLSVLNSMADVVHAFLIGIDGVPLTKRLTCDSQTISSCLAGGSPGNVVEYAQDNSKYLKHLDPSDLFEPRYALLLGDTLVHVTKS